jgi:hypothetical protein
MCSYEVLCCHVGGKLLHVGRNSSNMCLRLLQHFSVVLRVNLGACMNSECTTPITSQKEVSRTLLADGAVLNLCDGIPFSCVQARNNVPR